MEELAEGDLVLSRDESDSDGPILARPVEAAFRRLGSVLGLWPEGGLCIRTTPEHPFFADGHGWTQAGSLRPGMRLLQGGPGGSLGVDHFSASWSGRIRSEYAEDYTFFTHSDDGVKVWITDEAGVTTLLIDHWNVHSAFEDRSAKYHMDPGKDYRIQVDYFEDDQYAVARLFWMSDSQVKEIVPQSQLYPDEAHAVTVWSDYDDDYALRGDTVTFYADIDEGLLADKVEWDFEYDGVTFNVMETTQDPEVTHAFPTFATRTVAARVGRGIGGTIGTESIQIWPLPPKITPHNDMVVTAGHFVTLALDVTYQEANASNETSSVDWWYSYDGQDWAPDPTVTGFSSRAPFDYYGTYEMWAEVTDVNGESDTVQFSVDVRPAKPLTSATATPEIDEGSSATFTLSPADDDPADPDDDPNAPFQGWGATTYQEKGDAVAIYVDFKGTGDFDEVSSDLWTILPNGSISFQHFYDDNQGSDFPYIVTIRVEEESGLFSDFYVSVAVKNVLPTGQISMPSGPFAHAATSGDDLYDLGADGRVEFVNVSDPSEADRAGLKYAWTIDGVDSETSESFVKIPNDGTSKVHTVSGYVFDKDATPEELDQLKAQAQVFKVVSRSATWTRPEQSYENAGLFSGIPFPQGEGLFADLKFNGQGIDRDRDAYDAYAGGRIYRDITADQEFTLDLTLGESAQKLTSPRRVAYYYDLFIYDISTPLIGSQRYNLIGHELFTSFSANSPVSSGGQFKWTAGPDREVDVFAWAQEVDANNQAIGPKIYYEFQGRTASTPSFLDRLATLRDLIRKLGDQLAEAGSKILNKISNDGLGVVSQLATTFVDGLSGAATQFFNEFQTNSQNAFFKWLIGRDLDAVDGVDLTTGNGLLKFALEFSGLTGERIQTIIFDELGRGNAVAIGAAAKLFQGQNLATVDGVVAFFDHAQTLASDPELGNLVASLNLTTIKNSIVTAVTTNLTKAIPEVAAQFAAKFAPGAGAVRSLVQGVNWLLDNQQQLGDFFTRIFASVDDLLTLNTPTFQAKMAQVFRDSLGLVMGFGASQLGLTKVRDRIREAVAAVPRTVETNLRKAVRTLADKLGGGTKQAGAGKAGDGLLSKPVELTYRGKVYVLRAVHTGSKSLVNVSVKEAGGGEKFVAELTDAHFEGVSPLTALRAAEDDLAAALKAAGVPGTRGKSYSGNGGTPAANVPSDLVTKQAAVATALGVVRDKIIADACKLLKAGCFAAGTLLWTPEGWRAVEEVKAGDLLFSRDENDPCGPVEARPVEEVFRRLGSVLVLGLPHGRTIRTTPEHPFWKLAEGSTPGGGVQGEWVEAGTLAAGDRLLLASGECVALESVEESGEDEEVYNCRVAEYHTYFVGGEGCEVWAHNVYTPMTADRRQYFLNVGRNSYNLDGTSKTVTNSSGKTVTVTGIPQQTLRRLPPNAGPHVTGILVVLGQMVENGYTDIYMNQAVHTIPGFRVGLESGGRNRPDLVGVRQAVGSQSLIDICEVLSIGQPEAEPIDSASQAMGRLTNPARRGDINLFNDQGTELLQVR